ncbi:hypothetical protein BgiMline_000390 [Biomphalaria glabrata]
MDKCLKREQTFDEEQECNGNSDNELSQDATREHKGKPLNGENSPVGVHVAFNQKARVNWLVFGVFGNRLKGKSLVENYGLN